MTKGRAWALGLALLVASGCATVRPGTPGTEPLTLSIQNLACSDCGKELEAKALTVAGVKDAHFDARRIELQLRVVPGTTAEPVVTALESEPLDGKPVKVLVGPGHGAYAAFAPPNPSWDVKLLSGKGEDVPDLRREVPQGKVTVVDFYADWCGPCHALDEHMHQLLSQDRELAYRRINVVDWDSPVARHYLANAKGLPYVLVMNAQGQQVAELAGATPEALDGAIRQGKAR